ncbi:GTPases - sulfate adenylate transferase subunit 1 [Vibrio ponticus]|nr:GTPases - sulfate adenylate transferase subunit 1 [Vibrio ponticus]
MRDQVVFTNKRVIAANVQGLTGSKVDYTSLPYSKVNAFSIETSGTFDLDCEIELYLSEVGRVRFEIKGTFDIVQFNRIISEYVLG